MDTAFVSAVRWMRLSLRQVVCSVAQFENYPIGNKDFLIFDCGRSTIICSILL